MTVRGFNDDDSSMPFCYYSLAFESCLRLILNVRESMEWVDYE